MSGEEITIGQLFDYLTRKFDDIDKRFSDGDRRFDKIEYVTSQTLLQAQATNGRVSRLEDWQDGHISAHDGAEHEAREAERFEAGRESERRRVRHVLGEVMDRIERPLMYGLAAVLVGVGIRLGAWFVGGLW